MRSIADSLKGINIVTVEGRSFYYGMEEILFSVNQLEDFVWGDLVHSIVYEKSENEDAIHALLSVKPENIPLLTIHMCLELATSKTETEPAMVEVDDMMDKANVIWEYLVGDGERRRAYDDIALPYLVVPVAPSGWSAAK